MQGQASWGRGGIEKLKPVAPYQSKQKHRAFVVPGLACPEEVPVLQKAQDSNSKG